MAIDPTGNLKREDLTGFNEGHDSEVLDAARSD